MSRMRPLLSFLLWLSYDYLVPAVALAFSRDPNPPPFRAQQLSPPATEDGIVPAADFEDDRSVQAPYVWERLSPEEALQRADEFHRLLSSRRTVRFFSPDPVPLDIVRRCVETAGTAPSGAHQQPWTFCVVKDPDVKARIRSLVEEEERLNYESRMSEEWKDELRPMISGLHVGGHVEKPYLTDAPYVVVLMKRTHELDPLTEKRKTHYYVEKSCGICAGMFCAALHNANLATLCSTPMHAEEGIRKLLGRPENERVYLLMPVGYPSEDCTVPYRDATSLRKPLHEILKVI